MPLLRPCRNTAAFELLPEHQCTLDLDRVEESLRGVGYRRVVRAGVMLIMRREQEVSVYRSGKMLIKTRDPGVAEGTARELLGLVGPEPGDGLRTEGFDRVQARSVQDR